MKKLLVLIIAFFAFANAYSQEHLSFKGVPIDGTLDAYVANMKKAGFEYLGESDGVAMLEGDFAGYRNCTICVITLESIDVVNRIAVLFEEEDKWANLYGNYSNLKEMLTMKYGKYEECVEEFEGSTQPRDDFSKMYELSMDRCKYYTVWKTDKGSIELTIVNDLGDGVLRLSYWDKINTLSVQQKALEDL